MSTPIRILGITGSLRRESYNRAALRAATKLVPNGAIVETFELDGIPPFNQDEEQNPPSKVIELDPAGNLIDAMTKEFILALLQNLVEWTRRIGPK